MRLTHLAVINAKLCLNPKSLTEAHSRFVVHDMAHSLRLIDETQPWRCGDPYSVPVETALRSKDSEEEHWRTVADYIIKREKETCNVWKEEVKNLLTFVSYSSLC